MNRKFRSQDEWDLILAEFSRSGLNRREFCEREGLSYSTFNSAIARRRGRGGVPAVSHQSVGGFVEVEVPNSLTVTSTPEPWPNTDAASSSRGELVVELPLGVTLRFKGVA